jgi:hypothetical protein
MAKGDGILGAIGDYAKGVLYEASELSPISDIFVRTPEEKFQTQKRDFLAKQMKVQEQELSEWQSRAPLRERERDIREKELEIKEKELKARGLTAEQGIKEIESGRPERISGMKEEAAKLDLQAGRARLTSAERRDYEGLQAQNVRNSDSQFRAGINTTASSILGRGLNAVEMNQVISIPEVQGLIGFEATIKTALEKGITPQTLDYVNGLESTIDADFYEKDGKLFMKDLSSGDEFEVTYDNLIKVHNKINEVASAAVKPHLIWNMNKGTVAGRVKNRIAAGLMVVNEIPQENIQAGFDAANQFMKSQRPEDLQHYALVSGLSEYLNDGKLTSEERQQILPELEVFARELGIKYEADNTGNINIVQDDGSRLPLQEFFKQEVQKDVIGNQLQKQVNISQAQRAVGQETEKLKQDRILADEGDPDAGARVKVADIEEAVAPLQIREKANKILSTGNEATAETVKSKLDKLKALRDQFKTIEDEVHPDGYTNDEIRAADAQGITIGFPFEKDYQRLKGLHESLVKYEEQSTHKTQGQLFFDKYSDIASLMSRESFPNVPYNDLKEALYKMRRTKGSKVDVFREALMATGKFGKGRPTRNEVYRAIPKNYR